MKKPRKLEEQEIGIFKGARKHCRGGFRRVLQENLRYYDNYITQETAADAGRGCNCDEKSETDCQDDYRQQRGGR